MADFFFTAVPPPHGLISLTLAAQLAPANPLAVWRPKAPGPGLILGRVSSRGLVSRAQALLVGSTAPVTQPPRGGRLLGFAGELASRVELYVHLSAWAWLVFLGWELFGASSNQQAFLK
jgi:hypothetical protein